MRSPRWFVLAVAAAACVCLAGSDARATVLTFDVYNDEARTSYPNGGNVPVEYGDNVTDFSPAAPVGGKYVSYGSGGGTTANVTTHYEWAASANHASRGVPDMYLWNNLYGDLTNVTYHGNGAPPTWGGAITFTPSAGYAVGLDSFNVASYNGVQTTGQIQVWSDFGTPSEVKLFDTGAGAIFPGTGHVPYTLNLVGPVDAPLTLFAITSGNTGLDDIQFREVIPEPAAASIAGLAALTILPKRPRRRH